MRLDLAQTLRCMKQSRITALDTTVPYRTQYVSLPQPLLPLTTAGRDVR